jgi:hypothetical protein
MHGENLKLMVGLCLLSVLLLLRHAIFDCGSQNVFTDLHQILGLQKKYYSESLSSINYALRKEMKMLGSTYPTPEM